ncbi:serine/threonine-protein kinase [Micromonospora sp. WMMA1363]|uniref:serine/threonine-protein kinase n=1 Tax=Micromonospora sp. WMMA1363 TaxID=3053985 RepID=UPI00259CE3C6|nr:serine/threonine-protein kinase [Micromonospora sp. WMMA1363]MDM4718814.1 serine/threonine-protein kinase [Micromonospora sp. WMMA1363]
MLSPGVVLSSRYRLDERVATGGMGDVWRGTDLVLGRPVAVKVLLPALVSDPDFTARFRSEARIMAALRHPGIVQVFDYGEDRLADGGRADFLVMEFVHGEPLSRRIEVAGRIDVAETMSIVAQVAQALHAAHRGGIVHRDVKPSNLLVQENGSVVLVDFGVARSTNVTSITSTNAVPGTALYMAPEQAAGRPVSGATDIYALGAVAYCCLSGAPPFTGDNPLQVAVRHLDDEPPELPHDIPEAVRALVARALAKDPASRFSSGAAMAEAAQSALSDPSAATALMLTAAPAALRSAGPATRTDSPATAGRRRGRAPLVGAAAAVLVGLAGLAAALGTSGAADAPAVRVSEATVPTDDTDGAAVPVVVPQETSIAPQRSYRTTGSTSRPSPSASQTPSEPPSPTPEQSTTAPPTTTPPTPSPKPTTPDPGATTTTPPPPDPTATTTEPANKPGV